MNKNNKIAPASKVLKTFSETNMKVCAWGCSWFFYQDKVPQKILDRYKK